MPFLQIMCINMFVCCFLFRVNSSLHATIVSCMCVYALLYEEELEEEPIW